jgi:transcriptional regulator with GAF, ATPase, and Fis domain
MYAADANGGRSVRTLIGQSPAMRALLRKIERVGPSDATVLILGERGTGKELVAHALVAASPRRGRPFVTVNCAALPAELLASELFGHERGAFTGATERRAGLLRAADGGTVFLDEVGDLSGQGQAMLLRALQEGEIRSLGSAVTTRVDIRVIAATNRDLRQAIAHGQFRPDLYDRLNEVVLAVPPLSERPNDIRPLAHHFLDLHARRHGVCPPELPTATANLLLNYAWPGNVRELEKAISRAVLFAERVGFNLGTCCPGIRRTCSWLGWTAFPWSP